jgi:hypothetical protein
MQPEMRDISGDLKERAKGQIDGTEARFSGVITELQKERATHLEIASRTCRR